MIPHGVDIYFGVEPIDLRWGFDRLCGIVSERIGRRPRSGALFAFFNRVADAFGLEDPGYFSAGPPLGMVERHRSAEEPTA